MKKLLCLVLSLVIGLHLNIVVLCAENPVTILQLADEYITENVIGNETVYDNLDEFIIQAREQIPEVTDLELADAIIQRVGLDYSATDDTEKLELLDIVEIRKTLDVYCISDDNSTELTNYADISPRAIWESEDEYLQIITYCYVGTKLPNGDIPYILESTATWLREPGIRLEDNFAIVHGGVFDDSYDVTAKYYKLESCGYCGNKPYVDESEVYNGTSGFTERSDYIELDFSNANAINMIFPVTRLGCRHYQSSTSTSTVNYAAFVTMYVKLKYRVYITSTTQACAAYAHKEIGSDISIGVTIEGQTVTPTFNMNLFTIMTSYPAAPVTLRAT